MTCTTATAAAGTGGRSGAISMRPVQAPPKGATTVLAARWRSRDARETLVRPAQFTVAASHPGGALWSWFSPKSTTRITEMARLQRPGHRFSAGGTSLEGPQALNLGTPPPRGWDRPLAGSWGGGGC